MKRKTAYEYIALIFLSLGTGFILYRQIGASASIPVYAATMDSHRPPTVSVPITQQERQVIREYLNSFTRGKPPKVLPAGLARSGATRERLPSDWEKKLVKGQVLPAGIYRETSPLPKELASHLPPCPLGTVLVAIDGRIVRLGRANFEVLDVFDTRL